MPILSYYTQQINISVHSKFVKRKIFEMSMPYSPHKAMNGYYSKLWRRMKPEVISGFGVKESTATRLTVSGRNENGTDVKMEFDSGIIVTFPAEITKENMAIILAQLEVLKMSCKNRELK